MGFEKTLFLCDSTCSWGLLRSTNSSSSCSCIREQHVQKKCVKQSLTAVPSIARSSLMSLRVVVPRYACNPGIAYRQLYIIQSYNTIIVDACLYIIRPLSYTSYYELQSKKFILFLFYCHQKRRILNPDTLGILTKLYLNVPVQLSLHK